MFFKESPFSLPIRIEYRPPHWLLFCLAISHLGAIICLLSTSVPYWLKGLLIFGTIISFIRYYRFQWRWHRSRNPTQLLLTADDEWIAINERGDSQKLILQPGSFVHPYLVILRFDSDNKQQFVFILTVDTVDSHTLRCLRVRLKFKKTNKLNI